MKVPHLFRVVRALARLVIMLGIGYLSSAASTGRCEIAAARRIEADIGQRIVFVLPKDPKWSVEYPESEAILARAGLTVRACEQAAPCMPWGGVARASIVGPFLVDVRWGVVASPQSGHGTRTRYVAFFGLVLPIRDLGGWIN